MGLKAALQPVLRGFSVRSMLLAAAAMAATISPALAQNVPWHGYGGDAQHNAQAPAPGQSLANIHWSIPVDLSPPGFLGVHYGEPMITAANTVLLPVKVDSAGTYQMEAHSASDGSLLWKDIVSYRFPPYDWDQHRPTFRNRTASFSLALEEPCASATRRIPVRATKACSFSTARKTIGTARRLRRQRDGEHTDHGGCLGEYLFWIYRHRIDATWLEEWHCTN